MAVLGTAATLLVAIALLQADLPAATRVFTQADAGWVGGGVILMTTGLVFLAARWRSLMPTTTPIALLPLTAILVTGTLMNYALPGPVGEFVAAGMAARRWHLPPEQTFAAGIHARFVGLAMAGFAALLLFAMADLPVPDAYRTWIGGAAVFIAVGAVALFLLSANPRLLRWGARVCLGLSIWPRRVADPLLARLEGFADALAAVGHLGAKRYATAALWALGGHACVTGGIAMAAIGLGSAPSLAGLVFTYAMTTAGAVVLFAFPGSQVGWDAMFSTLLVATAGLPLQNAIGVAVIVRTQQLVVVMLGALALVLAPSEPQR